jgi:hypothetical protein
MQKDLVINHAAKFPDLPTNRKILGAARFASLRKTHAEIATGNPLPAPKYKYRVSGDLLKVAVEYLISTLPVLRGRTRNFRFANHVFRNMPLYKRGGDSARLVIYREYGSCQKKAGVKALGKHSFEELTRLLTTKGEIKTGLSTYYIKLRYATSLFQKMITRLGTIEGIGYLPGRFVPSESEVTGTAEKKSVQQDEWKVADDCEKLSQCMEAHVRFLAHSYSKQHLNIDDAGMSSHSCRFAVNAEALDGHPTSSNCKKCVDCMTFFSKTSELLDHSDGLADTDHPHDVPIQKEIESIGATRS